ncbi:MFS transporter, partial [Pseudomonas syringae pv. tagetis]
RKAPIIGGLLLSTSIVTCNYVDIEWGVVGFMALAFFGKGVGALGWAVMSDVSPKQIAGLIGGLFNTFGNIASIPRPI